MRNWGWIFALAVLVALPAFAQSAFPDLRGTWKGQSESIISGTANPHQDGTPGSPPRYSSVPFTFVIDKQDGRRFSGTFSSPQQTESVIGVISKNRRGLLRRQRWLCPRTSPRAKPARELLPAALWD